MSKTSLLGLLCLSLGAIACGGGDGGADAASGTDATTGDSASPGAITGTIRTAMTGEGAPAAAAGVTVGVLGGDATTTTDATGFYSLEAPAGLTRLVASKAEHWGTIYTLTHTTTDATDVNFEIIPNQLVADVSAELAAPIDPTDGVVFVDFDTEYAGGGEAADVTTSEGVLTFDAGNAVVEEGPNLVAGGGDFLLFYGVPAGTTTPTVTGASGVNTCVLDPAEATTYPVQAATFTFVHAVCTPL